VCRNRWQRVYPVDVRLPVQAQVARVSRPRQPAGMPVSNGSRREEGRAVMVQKSLEDWEGQEERGVVGGKRSRQVVDSEDGSEGGGRRGRWPGGW